MSRLACTSLLLLLSLPTRAQDEVPRPRDVQPYAGVVDIILRQALESGRAYERLTELCTRTPHRLAGSEGAAQAEQWAQAIMLEDGLESVRLEQVMAPHWVRGNVGEVVYVEPAEWAGESVPMLALGGSVATPAGGVEAEVVLAHGLDHARTLGERAKDRIVLFNGRLDPGRLVTFEGYGDAVGQRVHGASTAARLGAVAALVRSMTPNLDDVPHTGAMRYADDAPAIPTAAISTNAAERIATALQQGRRVVLRFQQDCQTLPDAPNHNVVGDYLGREQPEQIVLVGGHLDCWDVGQGAHDDGAGCCQALEAVRLLKSLGLRPRRTIRVVLFANEENGLAGGRGYRAAHAAEMPQHLLALESDSGAFTPRGFETNANPEARAVLEAIAELLAEAGAATMAHASSGGADIGPMRDAGVIQVGFLPDWQRYFDLHHTDIDTLDKVNPRELHLGAGVIAALLYVVADLPAALPRNPLPEG